MQLNAMPLFHQQAFVAGQWCDADSHQSADIYNPATQEIIGSRDKCSDALLFP